MSGPAPKSRGGVRPRAGRKRIAPEEGLTRPLTVWLTPPQIERLRGLGGGNASKGVRRLLDERPPSEG